MRPESSLWRQRGKHKGEGAKVTHWLEGEPGWNVTLCINDANLCLGKCVCMTRRTFEEVAIIPWRNSSWISCKGTCFIWGLPHMGICYVGSVSFLWINHLSPSIYSGSFPVFSSHCSQTEHFRKQIWSLLFILPSYLNILTVSLYSSDTKQERPHISSRLCKVWLPSNAHQVTPATFSSSEHTLSLCC